MVNFKGINENKKVFAAVSGFLLSYTPFSFPDKILLNNIYCIRNLDKFAKEVPTDNVTKYFKEYKGKLNSHVTNESKNKKVLIMSSPIPLPLFKDTTLKDVRIEENTFYENLGILGKLYADGCI